MHRGILALILTAMLITVSVAIDSIPQAEGRNIGASGTTLPGSRGSSSTGGTESRTRPTDETKPPRTTTTLSNSTTTTPQATTTKPAPTTTVATSPTTTKPPSNSGGTCANAVLNQIISDQTNQKGLAKKKFDIILTLNEEGSPGVGLWVAPYLTDLGNGYGWISGDRKGYSGAYMFLVNLDTGKVVARVTFHQVPTDGAYFKVNDSGMEEIQETGLGYDGTCADGSAGDPNDQSQTPSPNQDYVVDNSPEVRPLVPIYVNGSKVEDRSYTNTVTPGTDFFRFSDGGLITKSFTDYNGVGGTPHTVYQRQRVIARVNIDGDFFTAGVVYYDILDPSASFTG